MSIKLKPLMNSLTRHQVWSIYKGALESNNADALRRLCREDLFFLLVCACRRKDLDHDWIYERIREVEAAPDGHMDLWAREHGKSSIITFGLTIKEILNNPEVTICIFSHTSPKATDFLAQIKREFEMNRFLKRLFPEILYEDPQKESICWSNDKGIIVKRQGNPPMSTIEASGLVDGLPTGKHFDCLVYDDVVTERVVTSPEMINKVTDSWALSLLLGSKTPKIRYIGTRYHMNDTYKVIIEREAAIPRFHYPTDLGKDDLAVEGNPYFMTKEQLKKKRKSMGPYIYGCQMLMNPKADRQQGFEHSWINTYEILRNHQNWNYYITVDPASKKKLTSDYTVMLVIALAPDNNYYLVDGIRDRLNLTGRCKKLFELHKKWPIKKTGYEQYGMQADIEHIQYVQEQEGYRFPIEPLGGGMAKEDRIKKLVPIFEQGRFWLPRRMMFINNEEKYIDLIDEFISKEYLDFPVCTHDDILDCMSRIVEENLMAVFPKLQPSMMPSVTQEKGVEKYDVLKGNLQGAKVI